VLRDGVGSARFTRSAHALRAAGGKEAAGREGSDMETPAARLENVEVNTSTTNTTWRHVGEDVAAAAAAAGDGGDRHHVYLLLAVYPIVFLFGVFGNTLVITVILKYV